MTNELDPPVPDLARTVAGRRTFSEAEKWRIIDEASQPGVSVAQVGRRYRIAPRVLFRWKEALRPKPPEAEMPAPVFAPVQTMDAAPVA
jgi:transposase